MKRSTQAWLLDCGGGVLVATGLGNVLHVVEDTRLLFKVPLAPPHCNRVLLWQQHALPAVDLALLVTGATSPATRSYACVLGWLNERDETEHGVLLTRSLPRQLSIGDEQQAKPGDRDVERWRGIALGFFTHNQRLMPIINPASLFGTPVDLTKSSLSSVTHLSA